MSKHFDGDLAAGKLREDAFARILLAGRELWEHKRDLQCERTGNIAIEYQTSTLPNGQGDKYDSGISVCEAHWFVIEFIEERRLVLPTEVVKELARVAIRANLAKWIGDNNRFHNALIPVTWFWAYSGTAENTSAPDLRAVVTGWEGSLPTLAQAREYYETGTFKPDPQGWDEPQATAA
jgi:hypothetical protein